MCDAQSVLMTTSPKSLALKMRTLVYRPVTERELWGVVIDSMFL